MPGALCVRACVCVCVSPFAGINRNKLTKLVYNCYLVFSALVSWCCNADHHTKRKVLFKKVHRYM